MNQIIRGKNQPTDFQKQVWDLVRQIPSGKVTTYGDIAKALGSHPRPVGQAFRHTPIDVPWWRVVQKGGAPLAAEKEWVYAQITLLEHEGIRVEMRVPEKWWWSPDSGTDDVP